MLARDLNQAIAEIREEYELTGDMDTHWMMELLELCAEALADYEEMLPYNLLWPGPGK